jgi:2'-5' RNA ligase
MDDHGPFGIVRAFVATPVPSRLVLTLQKFQAALRARLRGNEVRWGKPEQLHLTLKFLGDVAEGTLSDLAESLKCACAGTTAFQLGLKGIGCFPDIRNPRVIWVGVNGELEKLRRLQERIEAATKDCGDHAENHAFQPHLTIARVKAFGRETRPIGEVIEKTKAPQLGRWQVQQIELMQSELTPQGSRYTALATFALS